MAGQEKSSDEDLTMSTFPMPNYLAENAARFEKMSKDFGATLPKDMAVAINLMSHPAAGIAALTAVGFGMAGQAFGMWAGAVVGAAEASQRLLTPLGPSIPKSTAPSTVTAFDRPKPVLKVVAKTEPAAKVVVKAEPAAKTVAKVEPVKPVVAKVEPAAKVAVKAEPAAKAVAKVEPVKPVVAKIEPAPAKRVVAKAEPTAKLVAPKAEPVTKIVAAKPVAVVKPVAAKAEPAPKPTAAPMAQVAPAAAKTDAPALMPEDFHKPRAMERPARPDDLKAISGIGPKLEKILNDLGVWTYAQVAAWGNDEIAWVDDYLSFSGRIGRDKWIEQAAALAAAAKPAKG
jgi:NADH-quinone oxidoreductase subunit E